jgi:hypothetical protein
MRFGDGDGATDGRMTGERQLFPRREDTHVCGVVGIGGCAEEDRLGEIELARDGLHLRVAEIVRVPDDGERIAGEARVGEDVVGGELEWHSATIAELAPRESGDRA